jgi:HSP20 family protein
MADRFARAICVSPEGGQQGERTMAARENVPATKPHARDVQTRNAPHRPLGAFSELQHEIDRVFDAFRLNGWRTPFAAFEGGGFSPSMEVTETEKSIEVTMEIPGIDEKDIEILVANDVLTVRGEKKAEREETDKNYRLLERSYGHFERSISLPSGTSADAVKASTNKGVLKLSVPKPTAAQAQKVHISTAS